MKFAEFESQVTHALKEAAGELGYQGVEPDVLIPSDPSFGDLSSSLALKLSKVTHEKPYEIANKICIQIKKEKYSYIGSVKPHENGYINVELSYRNFILDAIKEIIDSERVGFVDLGKGRKVLIEHTNVNPNKALHIGHARNLVFGDSLSRIMRHLGYDVNVLNYIDDSGSQVADVIVGFKFLGISDEPPEGVKFDSYCGDHVYVTVNKMYEVNKELSEKKSFILREIEKGEGEIAEYTKRIVDRIVREQLRTCWRLGASYDLLNWETHIVKSGIWAKIFDEMKKKGLAVFRDEGENKGCWVMIDDKGEEKVLVRSDGTTVYIAKDIPYAAWKIGIVDDPFRYKVYLIQPDGKVLWTTTIDGDSEHPSFSGADIAISVIDTRQSNLQRLVSMVLERLREGSSNKYIHRGYEVVALSRKTASSLGIEASTEFIHMQGRKGIYVNVDTVLDALKRRAIEETRKRNPGESNEWIDEVAESIAIAALRFELIKQDPDKIIVFDIDEALRLEGDTGPYLLYTYARAIRIIEKSNESPAIDVEGASRLTNDIEKELVKHLSRFDKAVILAGDYLSPREVAKYAYRLCSLFNEFYERLPVIKEQDRATRLARLSLVLATTKVLRQALGLIGIKCTDRI